MFDSLPRTSEEFQKFEWEAVEPFFVDLLKRPLTQSTVAKWLADWGVVKNLILETFARLRVATTADSTDKIAKVDLEQFLNTIFTPAEKQNNQLINKLLKSNLSVPGMALPLQKMKSEADLFSDENLTLFTEEINLASQYNQIVGTQTVDWEGESRTLTQMRTLFDSPDRTHREEVWHQMSTRQLADRSALNELWQALFELRQKVAKNAGFDNYLAYRWKYLKRFDYSPSDSVMFHEAIEKVVVPAANRVYQKLADELGVDTLRPWDVNADIMPLIYPRLVPMGSVADLAPKSGAMFHQVDTVFGEYFETMRRENLLDLPNRPGKAPGGYCTYFSVDKRPFIFMNAVGSAGDVRTMLHEAGHAFHAFESSHLPYPDQRHPGHEFSEVASMAMELMASPYLTSEFGGFYDSSEEAARHRLNHLRKIITFWPYMAVVDSFQHWVYRGGDDALNPDLCDAKWAELWKRFLPMISWAGLETEMMTGWHRKQHIFRAPFYYVEYGMAQVGAVQVWRNVLEDRAAGIQKYREALALGGTHSLRELYSKAGAKFQFDVATMKDVVSLLEEKIEGMMDKGK